MKPWLGFFFAVFFAVLITPLAEAQGNVYYVSQLESCDDSWEGNSTNPWCTIDKAFQIATYNDTVLIRDGNYGGFIYTSSTDFPIYTGSMTEPLPADTEFITFKADAGHSPVFTNINLGNSANNYYIPYVFEGIGVEPGVGSHGVELVGAVGVRLKNSMMIGNYDGLGYGVELRYGGDHNNDIKIEGSTIRGFEIGIHAYGSNIVITGNDIYEIGQDHVQIASGLVSGYNILIENNHIHHTTPFTADHPDGIAFVDLTNVIVRNNTIHDLAGQGIFDHDAGLALGSDNVLIENNLMYNVGVTELQFDTYCTGENWTIRNNTIVGANIVQQVSLDGGINHNVYNNIFICGYGAAAGVLDYYDHNIYIKRGDTPGNDESNSHGYDYLGNWDSTHDAIEPELFVDAANHDYRLRADHPGFLDNSNNFVHPCNMSTTGGYVGALPCAGAPEENCTDGIQNQDETDIDCGGVICNGCANGQLCLINSDCLSGNCTNNVCVGAPVENVYYLDAVNGDDSWNGNSTHPWNTIDKAQSVVVGGDTVIIRNGSYGDFVEANVIHNDWITYQADTGHEPVFSYIKVYRWPSKGNAYLRFKGISVIKEGDIESLVGFALVDNIQLIDMKIVGNGHRAGDSPMSKGISLRDTNNVLIDGCEIYGTGPGLGSTSTSGRSGAAFGKGFWAGIYSQEGWFAENITIQNCEIYSNHKGIRASGSDWLITNNHIYNSSGDGIVIAQANTAASGKTKPIIVSYNHIHDLGQFAEYGVHNDFIQFNDLETNHIIIRGNDCHDSDQQGFFFQPARTLTFTSGGPYQIQTDDVITGDTSGASARVYHILISNGTWGEGNAEGVFRLADQIGSFQAENLNVGSTTDVATISGDSTSNTDWLIEGNVIVRTNLEGDGSAPVRLFGANNITFRNNTIDGLVTGQHGYDKIHFTSISNNILYRLDIYTDPPDNAVIDHEDNNILGYKWVHMDNHVLGGNSVELGNDVAFQALFVDYAGGNFSPRMDKAACNGTVNPWGVAVGALPCVEAPAENCSDNIQNQDETGVDCGGSCIIGTETGQCDDTADNDHDCFVDCNDSDCSADPACTSSPGGGAPGFELNIITLIITVILASAVLIAANDSWARD